MTAIHDLSSYIPGRLPSGVISLAAGFDMEAIEQHVLAVHADAKRLHSDSAAGAPVNWTGALWDHWIGRCTHAGAHADAKAIVRAKAHAEQLSKGALTMLRARSGKRHADSGTTLPSTALRMTILGPDIVQPFQRAADILETIPKRGVQGDQLGYRRRFVIPGSGGGVTVMRGDQTVFNTVEVAWKEEFRPLHWAGIGVTRGYMEQRLAAAAGVPVEAYKQTAVDRAFTEFYRDLRLNGISGLDVLSLADNPALLRINSAVVLGTANIQTVYAEIVRVCTLAAEISPADMGPNTVILTDRIMNRLLATTSLPTQGITARDEFLKTLSELGITTMVKGKSLRDFGGTNIDGMALLRLGGDDGMAMVQGFDAAPVYTYNGPQGEVTIIACSFGDLEQPVGDGSLMALFEVTP